MGKIGQARGFLFFRIVNKFFFPQAKKKQKLFCAFIDLKQEFDTVLRAGLWQKL